MTWFANWFDSPYYPILYKHRNDSEAKDFIHHLLVYLKMQPQSRILDMACGRGRHSLELARHGYEALGMDLSPESIADALKSSAAEPQLLADFKVWDMRQPFAEQLGKFDAVFNLFTSFGYFESEEEHLQTLRNMSEALRHNDSCLVIDFFNAQRTIRQLVLSETKTVEDIDFQLKRYVENNYIVKDIRFHDKGQDFHFQERVRAFFLSDFEALLAQSGLRIAAAFGNYALQNFDADQSERLIIIAKHKGEPKRGQLFV